MRTTPPRPSLSEGNAPPSPRGNFLTAGELEEFGRTGGSTTRTARGCCPSNMKVIATVVPVDIREVLQ